MDMKKRLLEIKAELRSLRDSLVNAKDEELDGIESKINALESERANLNKKIALLNKAQRAAMSIEDGDDEENKEDEGNEEDGNANPEMRFVAKQGAAPKARKVNDPYNTEEYRKAFMEFACRGTEIPVKFRAATTTSDASAVIPTTILREIISELKTYGNLYAKVRKLNIQGGVNVPILSLKPTATWITANSGTSESSDQKIEAKTNITFSYYGLECKVAQTLLVNVTTLDMFEELFTSLVVEAMVKALDVAIIKGSGSGEPTGITTDLRVPSGNKITLSSTDITKWDEWKKKVFGKMKKSYRQGEFIMAQATFDGYIDGMVDSVGQPIGRVNYGIDGAETYRFGGKNVEIVEDDILKSYEDASSGDVFAIFVNLSDYAINSNMEMTTVRWVDNDTNQIKNKAILIADGKLIDPNGVLLIKKA